MLASHLGSLQFKLRQYSCTVYGGEEKLTKQQFHQHEVG